MSPLSYTDEGRHEKTHYKYWRESYYFNFVDDKAGIYGFTTIGWRVNEGEVDGILMVIRNRSPYFAYPAANRKFTEPWESFDLPKNCRVKRLHYDMIDPFRRWRLCLDGGRDSMDLDFSCFTPVYDYNAEMKSLPSKVAQEHYEQSGRVKGVLRMRGREFNIDGTGQRDHSWGIRDWGGVESWKWITAQFGDAFSFNVFSVTDEGWENAGGFIFDGEENSRIMESTIHLDLMPDGQSPKGAELKLVDERGRSHLISAQIFHVVPLMRHEAFIKECFARFYYKGMEGCGVVERLHHINSKLEKLRYVGAAARYAFRALFANTPLYGPYGSPLRSNTRERR